MTLTIQIKQKMVDQCQQVDDPGQLRVVWCLRCHRRLLDIRFCNHNTSQSGRSNSIAFFIFWQHVSKNKVKYWTILYRLLAHSES